MISWWSGPLDETLHQDRPTGANERRPLPIGPPHSILQVSGSEMRVNSPDRRSEQQTHRRRLLGSLLMRRQPAIRGPVPDCYGR